MIVRLQFGRLRRGPGVEVVGEEPRANPEACEADVRAREEFRPSASVEGDPR